MSLNARPGDTANVPESPQPSAVPGAYPTDDMSGAFAGADNSGSQRNKLHKPNDPRGWDTNKTPRTHQSSDSGVAVPDSDLRAGARDNTYQASQLNRDVPQTSNDRYDGMARAPTSGLGQSSQFQRQQAEPTGVREHDSPLNEKRNNDYSTTKTGAGAGAGAGLGSSMSQPGQENNDSNSEDPYWGDLPRGGGVYNTVIGHGSNEDEQARHDAHRQAGNTASVPISAVDKSSQGTTQQREFPLTGQNQTSYDNGFDNNRGHSHDLNKHSRDVNEQQKDDTHRKELYGAAGAATAASAAYPIARQHEQEKKDKHAEKAYEREQPTEQKESKIHALFHHDKDEKPAKAEKPKEKKEHVRHEKPSETVAPVYTERARDERSRAQEYSRDTEPSHLRDSRQVEHESKESRVKEGLGLGAAGAAGYGATRYAEKEHNKSEATSSAISDKPTDLRQSDHLASSQQHVTNDYGNRSAGDSKYNALASGTPSGVKQDNIGEDNTATFRSPRAEPSTGSSLTNQSSNHNVRNAAAATAASAAIVGSQYDKPSNYSYSADEKRDNYPTETRESQYTSGSIIDTREAKPLNRSQEQYETPKEQHYKPAQEQYVSREQRYEPTKEQQYASSKEQQYKPTQDQQYKSSKLEEEIPKESRNRETAALGAGAAATGAAPLAYKSHASPSERADTTQKLTTSPNHKTPVSSSEDGQYNHLASGTPSGINLNHE